SVDNAEVARIAQFSENVYFGKPCGLMDQTACAVGGFVAIDFKDASAPVITPLDFDMSKAGYSLCITNTKGNHSDLNDEYAAIPSEMKAVAKFFGKEVLRDVSKDDIVENIAAIRKVTGDRAVLRALHFVNENERVLMQTEALKKGDLDTFFDGVKASGNSSFKYLQNIFATKDVKEQGLSLALCISDAILGDKKGAYRVHGGGFAGTIQAFVAHEDVEEYKAAMDKIFGEGSCVVMSIRPEGAIKVY
ncbi:MAG: galactokinase, partial [Clostridia bacterium]|nr:galactokinase [Clostridia bacterium]